MYFDFLKDYMNEINWLYFLDNKGVPFLIYKNLKQDILIPNISILSHFLFGLRINTQDQNADVKLVEIEKDRYYLIEDINNNSSFILKTFLLSDNEKIFSLMKEIRSIYSKYFRDKENLDFQKKQEIFESFKKDVSQLIINNV